MRLFAGALVLAAALAGCGGEDGGGGGGPLTVYSGREEELVGPLFEQFTEETGIEVEVRYGDSAELAATIAEEGDNSPADVFFAQDAGSLGAVEDRLAELPEEIAGRVSESYRDPDGRWVGTSGRVRVVAFNTDELDPADLPSSILDFTDPKWKGKIGLPPTNASFQAMVTAMRIELGDDATREWLDGIKANGARFYEKNTPVLEALAAGEIQVGFVNHYYLYLLKEEQPDAPVDNHFLRSGDPGALVNVAGAGVLESSDDRDAAERFLEFLLSDEGQAYYATQAEEAEYPLVEGVQPREGLPPLDSLEGPDVDLDALGPELEQTLEMLNEAGFTS